MLTTEQIAELQQAFDLFDVDQGGTINSKVGGPTEYCFYSNKIIHLNHLILPLMVAHVIIVPHPQPKIPAPQFQLDLYIWDHLGFGIGIGSMGIGDWNWDNHLFLDAGARACHEKSGFESYRGGAA